MLHECACEAKNNQNGYIVVGNYAKYDEYEYIKRPMLSTVVAREIANFSEINFRKIN